MSEWICILLIFVNGFVGLIIGCVTRRKYTKTLEKQLIHFSQIIYNLQDKENKDELFRNNKKVKKTNS